jgi:hypothetical protein
MPRDSRAMTDLVEDFNPLTTDQITAMQRIICGNAKGRSLKAKVADADELMLMLGVHPSQADEWKFITRVGMTPVNELKVTR